MTGIRIMVAMLGFAAASATAQEAIVTDRPDSAAVLPKGSTQVETFWEYCRERHGEGHSWLAPNLLVRHGLSERAELRIEAPGWAWHAGGGAQSGDISIGSKLRLSGEGAETPRSLTVFATLPSGSARESQGRSDYGAWLAAERSLGDISLLINAGASRLYRDGARSWNGILWLSVGGDLRPGTAWYGELYADFPEGSQWEPVMTWGVSLLANATTQWDLYAGRGLDGNGPSAFAGIGYSVRFD
ncbi:MAG: transporter [Armatimonadota bacterium]